MALAALWVGRGSLQPGDPVTVHGFGFAVAGVSGTRQGGVSGTRQGGELVLGAQCAENLAKRFWGGAPMRSSGAGYLSKTPKRQSKSAIVPAAEGLLCLTRCGHKSPEAPFGAENWST